MVQNQDQILGSGSDLDIDVHLHAPILVNPTIRRIPLAIPDSSTIQNCSASLVLVK